MCGIAGMVGPGITNRDLDAFEELMTISAIRGVDSAGIFATWADSQHKAFGLEKDLCTSAELAKHSTLTKSMFYDLFIGHARWATVGQVNKSNAHPFKLGHIAGAHNGTLRDGRFLGRGKTDSECMFEEMRDTGVVETLNDMYDTSAWAISVWDERKKRLYLGRNNLRPLHIAFNEERAVLYWASEERFLKFLTEDTGDTKSPPLKLDIYYLSPNTIYEIDPKRLSVNERTPWETYEITPKKGPVYTSNTTTTQANRQYPDWMWEQQEEAQWADWAGWVDPKSAEQSASVLIGEESVSSSRVSVPSVSSRMNQREIPWFDYYCDDCGQEIKEADVTDGTALTKQRAGVDVHICLECRKANLKADKEFADAFSRQMKQDNDPDKPREKPTLLI